MHHIAIPGHVRLYLTSAVAQLDHCAQIRQQLEERSWRNSEMSNSSSKATSHYVRGCLSLTGRDHTQRSRWPTASRAYANTAWITSRGCTPTPVSWFWSTTI